MSDVVKHAATTHRMRDEGGTDPNPYCLPYIFARSTTTGDTITDDAELEFATGNGLVTTNDSDTFRFDPDDPFGVLVIRPGIYRMSAAVYYAGGSTSVPREMYPTAQLLSLGPLAGLGAGFGDSVSFILGPNQSQASVSQVTASNTIPKSVLSYLGIGVMSPVDNDFIRAAVILVHSGSNYSLAAGSRSALLIERIGGMGRQAKLPFVPEP